MQVLLLAKALVPADQLDPEDRAVPGTYRIELDEKVDRAFVANAALDGFHNHVPVGVLEDFEFSVHEFETGRDIDQDDGAESYEHGDMCRSVDKISKDLDALCSRSIGTPAPSLGM